MGWREKPLLARGWNRFHVQLLVLFELGATWKCRRVGEKLNRGFRSVALIYGPWLRIAQESLRNLLRSLVCRASSDGFLVPLIFRLCLDSVVRISPEASQKRPRSVPEASQKRPRSVLMMCRQCPLNDPDMTRIWLQRVPEVSQQCHGNALKMTWKWLENDSNIMQESPDIVPAMPWKCLKNDWNMTQIWPEYDARIFW